MTAIERLAQRPSLTIARFVMIVVGLGGCVARAGGPAEDVRWYRYALDLRSGETRYVTPLEPTVVDGRRYRVDTDARGRMTRVATFVGTKKVAEIAYGFGGVERWPRGYDYWATDGEQTTIVTIQRDEQGRRARQEFFLLDGRLTTYRVRTYTGDRVESVQFTAAGKREGRTVLAYSAEDVLTRARWYPGDGSTYYDTEIDAQTGLSKGRRKYRNGVLDSSSRENYDSGGLVTRSLHYDADGRPFGVTDFAEGLKVTSRYDRADGSSLEVRFSHDDKRRTRETRYAYNGRHICTLVYERLPNGRVVRSMALGPNGDVWAEYPDLFVEYIERSGEAVDRPGVAKIYKKGPWWPAPGGLTADRADDHGPRAALAGARGPWQASVHPLVVVSG